VGNVTIATNMAGRGTDIKLSRETTEAGGLHVIGTERHTARRIDNQLRGRGGRQGDPGSSRFYVSLEDELMKLFAGEWTIKVLGWLGMEEGMAIEDKRISKGILKAQKKVEERNFLARKNLLEYDEVMEHQRHTFYGMRQQVLEGHQIEQVIWGMIGDAIRDAVDKFITQDYVAANIAEWARVNFNVALDPGDFHGYRTYEDIEPFIKDQARAEAQNTINASLEEFTGESVDDQTAWNFKDLQAWAMREFHVQLTQAQIRNMDFHDLSEMLRASSVEHINSRDCAGIMKYLEPMYAETELAAWAREKFGVEINPHEFMASEQGGRNTRRSAEDIAERIEAKAREAYARREREYPVDHVLAFAFGGEQGTTENPYASDYVRAWARAKFGEDISLEHVRSLSVRKLRDELVALQEAWLGDGRIAAAVDELIGRNGSSEDLAKAANERWPLGITPEELEGKVHRGKSGAAVADQDGDGAITARDVLIQRVRQLLRKELTDLEQFILIQIFDQSWKDHLYAMDILKNSIGLQAFAEQDPRVLYKKEGFQYFQQMMAGVREKATDLIFRARLTGQTPQARSAYNVTSTTHEESEGYGVAENLRALPGEQSGSAEGGEVATAVKTIVREQEKVGRNDPCPCGSGKKYKRCCGSHLRVV
jgi:preprotein translocase subunit SecA